MRSIAFACALLAAVATAAHAGLLFNDDITVGIDKFLLGQLDIPEGETAGAPTDGGAGFILWGGAGLGFSQAAEAGIRLTWSGTTAPGSGLVQNVDLYRFGYDFLVSRTSQGEGPMTPVLWSLMLTFTDQATDFSQSLFQAGLISPHGGGVIVPFDQGHLWALPTMAVTNWSAVFNVSVAGDNGDYLSVELPQFKTIDFLYSGGGPASVPEPSGAVLLLSGLGASLLAARRRATRSSPRPRS